MYSRLRDVYGQAKHFDTKTVPGELNTLVVVVLFMSCAVWRVGFVSGVLLWMSAWLLFLSFEHTYLHHAQVSLRNLARFCEPSNCIIIQEHENRFTFLMGMYLAFTILFTDDSPLGFVGRFFPGLGYTLVFVCGFILCVWNRAAVSRAPHIPLPQASDLPRDNIMTN